MGLAVGPATDLAELMAQAAQQHGLVRAIDSPDPEAARKRLDRMRRRGLVGLVGRGVYRVEGSSDSWHQRALSAAWLVSPMALLSHRAALALWGLSSRRGVEVLVPVSRGGRPASVRVHQTRFLTAVDVDSRDRVPVTSIERTLVDAAAITPMGGLARLLDAAVEAGLATPKSVVERVRTMPTRGRKGMPILRVLLEERLGFPADETNPFEALMASIIIRSDLPDPRRQHPLDINGRRYYLDFAFPEFKVAIECDGMLGHGSAAAQAYDLERQNDIIESGWNLRRFPWSAVRYREQETLEVVRRAMISSGWCPPGTGPTLPAAN